MKLINFNAKIAQAKRELHLKCKEKGYEVDGLDMAENTEIEISEDMTLKISYTTEDFETYIIAYAERDSLEFDKVEFVTWIK